MVEMNQVLPLLVCWIKSEETTTYIDAEGEVEHQPDNDYGSKSASDLGGPEWLNQEKKDQNSARCSDNCAPAQGGADNLETGYLVSHRSIGWFRRSSINISRQCYKTTQRRVSI